MSVSSPSSVHSTDSTSSNHESSEDSKEEEEIEEVSQSETDEDSTEEEENSVLPSTPLMSPQLNPNTETKEEDSAKNTKRQRVVKRFKVEPKQTTRADEEATKSKETLTEDEKRKRQLLQELHFRTLFQIFTQSRVRHFIAMPLSILFCIGVITTWIFIGALIIGALEDWPYGTALFFCAVTITSLGLGDIFAVTVAGRAVNSFYALIGIGLVYVALAEVVCIIMFCIGRFCIAPIIILLDKKFGKCKSQPQRILYKSARKTLCSYNFILGIVSLTVVYFTSAGLFYRCEENHQDVSFGDSLYFTMTTLLLIGYGTYSPVTSCGRCVTVVTALTGVAFQGWVLVSVANVLLMRQKMQFLAHYVKIHNRKVKHPYNIEGTDEDLTNRVKKTRSVTIKKHKKQKKRQEGEGESSASEEEEIVKELEMLTTTVPVKFTW